jgi:hypothetical protein
MTIVPVSADASFVNSNFMCLMDLSFPDHSCKYQSCVKDFISFLLYTFDN